MTKSKLPRMQHLSRKMLCETRRIDFIAEHRVTEMMKMHANLMSPSGVLPAFDQACLIGWANYAIIGFGRASTEGRRAHSFSVDWMPTDSFFDHTSWLAQFSGR